MLGGSQLSGQLPPGEVTFRLGWAVSSRTSRTSGGVILASATATEERLCASHFDNAAQPYWLRFALTTMS